MVERVVETKEQEHSCIGASTPDEVHSTEVVAECENETSEYGIEEGMTKERVWTRKDEQGDPKKASKWLGWGCNMSGMSLACPTSKVWVHVASFGS